MVLLNLESFLFLIQMFPGNVKLADNPGHIAHQVGCDDLLSLELFFPFFFFFKGYARGIWKFPG